MRVGAEEDTRKYSHTSDRDHGLSDISTDRSSSSSSVIVRDCTGSVHIIVVQIDPTPGNMYVVDHADYAGPTRRHEFQ